MPEPVPDRYKNYFGRAPDKLKYLEESVHIVLAGSAAHDILQPARAHDTGDAYDAHVAREVLRDHWEDTEDGRAAHLDRLRQEVDAALRDNWRRVERIAVALLEKSALTGDELAALFEG